MSNNDSIKKRRVDSGISANGESGDGGVHDELRDIKSMMQELINQNHIQNRTQTNMMNDMHDEIANLTEECNHMKEENLKQTTIMQSMQGEITRLSEKCNYMDSRLSISLKSQSNVINNMQGDINRLEKKCNSMESSTITRFDNVDDKLNGIQDKLEYHEILLQNQKWKYSAPRPSAQVWSSLNENEVKKFLKQIQTKTEEMRYGTCNGNIIISTAPILPYNEQFLPHWKEFASALEQYRYCLKIDSISLISMELPDTVVDLLSNALKSTHFQKVEFKNNDFGQKGINFALDYLKNNPTLKTFSFVDNPINNIDDINKLCELVKDHPSIENLALGNCKGEDIDGYEILTRIMNAGRNNLVSIDLSSNDISTGGTHISDFLAANPILKSLYLDENKLNDRDALVIAKALKHNTKLRFLDLTDNNSITKRGWKALRKAEFDNTSLNAASVPIIDAILGIRRMAVMLSRDWILVR